MSRRRSIEVHGLHHGGLPIPIASVVDNVLFSGGIAGMDAETGKIPNDAVSQVVHLFKNIEKIVEAAGGTTNDIVKVTLYVLDRSIREAIDQEWVQMFPNEESRPARHTIVYAHLPATLVVQAEIQAILKERF
ncbi:RidA family protein [Bacillus sp. FJAT-29953]|nr:RidA family protein [Bacillus sp. FJAT-29953]